MDLNFEDDEQPEDLVDLTKKMHENFRVGDNTEQHLDYRTPGQVIKDYQKKEE